MAERAIGPIGLGPRSPRSGFGATSYFAERNRRPYTCFITLGGSNPPSAIRTQVDLQHVKCHSLSSDAPKARPTSALNPRPLQIAATHAKYARPIRACQVRPPNGILQAIALQHTYART
eukprot:15469381-Alexandrium_andersonii.AAC.1